MVVRLLTSPRKAIRNNFPLLEVECDSKYIITQNLLLSTFRKKMGAAGGFIFTNKRHPELYLLLLMIVNNGENTNVLYQESTGCKCVYLPIGLIQRIRNTGGIINTNKGIDHLIIQYSSAKIIYLYKQITMALLYRYISPLAISQ